MKESTKTDASTAMVPLPLLLEQRLRAHALALGPRNLLFVSKAGTPMSHKNWLERNLKVAVHRAGIRGVTHQVLRRTLATHLSKHAPVKAAQAILRHTSPETTFGYYVQEVSSETTGASNAWADELAAR